MPEWITEIRSGATPLAISTCRTACDIAMTRLACRQGQGRRSGKSTRRVATRAAPVQRAPSAARARAWLSWAWRIGRTLPRVTRMSGRITRGSSPALHGTDSTDSPALRSRRSSSLWREVMTVWLRSRSRLRARASSRTWRCPPRHSRPEATWMIRGILSDRGPVVSSTGGS